MIEEDIMSDFLFGAAYYDEYMPYDRIDEDFKLLKEGGFNTVRIAESTWSTLEPSDGVFDFTHIDRMLDAALRYDIKVIVGTPTYAIPSWMARKCPDILAIRLSGKCIYGARQQNNLLNPDYLRYCERIIRKLVSHVCGHPCVIGYQLDNETRSADDVSPQTQKIFLERIKKQYPDINDFNREFGLNYWSNSISSWDDFPDISGTINGSLHAAYLRFLRDVIREFLTWQAGIVNEYKKPGQFITHNFDFSWKGHSYGLHPLIDQAGGAECVDITGIDVYHESGSKLDGKEIAFGSDLARSLKKDNHIVLETQSQGNPAWLPYPGQLRLQAYSHVAGGAVGLLYWNWHSIHNAIESYWKGILSHDLLPGETYKELASFASEFSGLKDKLIPVKKDNRIAILVDNNSQVGLMEFPISDDFDYNDILRQIYDVLYEMNLECDIVRKPDDWSSYDLLIIPALYSANDDDIRKIRQYIQNGGHVLMTFKSCFSDDELKIYHDRQPHMMTDCLNADYDMFTIPEEGTGLTIDGTDSVVSEWMELLVCDEENAWAYYRHPAWNKYAAITHSDHGKGSITYLGCHTDSDGLKALVAKIAPNAGIDIPGFSFPIVRREGYNTQGLKISFFFNYSGREVTLKYEGRPATDLLNVKDIEPGQDIAINPWDLVIIEERN